MEVQKHQSVQSLRSAGKILFLLVAMCFFLYIQFRVQINNGFSVLYGDSYDAAIVVAILEHWMNVFRGDSPWSQLYYFYPYKNTLAQTDGYFLIAVIYSVIRQFGPDSFLASELSNIVVRAIGFLGFYWMMRKVFRVSYGWAVLSAGLFLIANNLTVHGTRVQLATLAFAPIVTVLLHQAYVALLAGDRVRLGVRGGSAGIALGAWALTCFYITWFFIFFTVILAFVLLCVADQQQRRALWQATLRHWWVVASVGLIAIIAMIPLLSVYLPKAAESGVRSYESALKYVVELPGILQVGETNILFGSIYNNAIKVIFPGYTWEGEYYNTGIAPIIFVLFCFATVAIFRQRKHHPITQFTWAVSLAVLITWACVIKVNERSLWFFVYTLFPGAKALNVVSAYQIFLMFPLTVVVTVYLARLLPRLPVSILCILGGMLIVEEMNRAYIHLDRKVELAKVANLTPAPAPCKVFYVSGWPRQESVIDNIYAHNVSAMLIAELLRMPTINGFASFNPPDWNLAYPNNNDYDQRVRTYLQNHAITDVCKLDLATKQWSPAPQ